MNGDDAHEVYKTLRTFTGVEALPWNFSKFLVDRKGEKVQFFDARQPPTSFESDIAKLLSEDLTAKM